MKVALYAPVVPSTAALVASMIAPEGDFTDRATCVPEPGAGETTPDTVMVALPVYELWSVCTVTLPAAYDARGTKRRSARSTPTPVTESALLL